MHIIFISYQISSVRGSSDLMWRGEYYTMIFYFNLDLKESTSELLKEREKKKDMTVWDEFLEKKKEKKKKKREEKQGKKETKKEESEEEDEPEEEDDEFSDDDIPSDVDLNDPYFKEEMDKMDGQGECLDITIA